MSFVNVTVRADAVPASSAAHAANGTMNIVKIVLFIPASLYRDLHLGIRPTTVIAEISGEFSRSVVHYGLEQIHSRLAGGRSCHRFSIHYLGFRRTKRHYARTPVFAPGNGHPDRLSLPL